MKDREPDMALVVESLVAELEDTRLFLARHARGWGVLDERPSLRFLCEWFAVELRRARLEAGRLRSTKLKKERDQYRAALEQIHAIARTKKATE